MKTMRGNLRDGLRWDVRRGLRCLLLGSSGHTREMRNQIQNVFSGLRPFSREKIPLRQSKRDSLARFGATFSPTSSREFRRQLQQCKRVQAKTRASPLVVNSRQARESGKAQHFPSKKRRDRVRFYSENPHSLRSSFCYSF